jgi:cbb3-type cytochrome oxidase maturation protein
MSVLFVLIGISIIVSGSFLTAFLWSISNGQYDDDYTPSVRILFDEKVEGEGQMAEGGDKSLSTVNKKQ